MAFSVLNPPPSRIALRAPVPPLPNRSFLFPPPRFPPLHLDLLLRSPPPRRVQSSSTPSSPPTPTDGSPTPPASREEAVAQARSCLATALRKPLNNSLPARKLKKQQRQPRFRAEIPVIDDSPGSLTRLAFDVFSGLGVSRKGSPARLLLVWPSSGELELAVREFKNWGGLGIGARAAGLGGAGRAGRLRRRRVPGAGPGTGGQAEGGRERAGPEAGGAVQPGVELRGGGGGRVWWHRQGLCGVLQRGVLLHGAGGEGPAEQEEGGAAPVRGGRAVRRGQLGAHGGGGRRGSPGVQGGVAAEAAADDRRGGEHDVQPHGGQLAGDQVGQVPQGARVQRDREEGETEVACFRSELVLVR